MTEVALVRIEDNAVVSFHTEGSGGADIPGVGRVEPPVADWEGGGELITTEGPPRYRLLRLIRAAQPPEGKRRRGSPRYTIKDRSVLEEFDIEDIPAPEPEPTRAEKFDRIAELVGLTPADFAAELQARLPKAGTVSR